jgi:hypothetical protein
MMKTQVGLGVLSIPAVFDTLGLIPGVIFKLRHRDVYDISDVGQLLFGRVGREILAVAFILCKYSFRTLKQQSY